MGVPAQRAEIRQYWANNFRVRIRRDFSQEVPVSDGVAIDVADAFNRGGGTNRNLDRDTRILVEDRLRWQRESWSFEAGVAGWYEKHHSVYENNFNGVFDFASLYDYCLATGFVGSNCQPTERIVGAALAVDTTPTYRDARGEVVEITGLPTTFTQTSGNAVLDITELGVESFLQADRGFGDTASLRLGVLYEATNHSIDFLRVSPIANLQYRLSQDTIVSGGVQVRLLDFRSYERLIRNDGSTHQKQLSISSPSFPDPFLVRLHSKVGEPLHMATSRNIAIRMARGEYVANQDADDWAHPQRIEHQLAKALEKPGRRVVFCSVIRVEDGIERFVRRAETHEEICKGFTRIANRPTIVSGTILAPRSLLLDIPYRARFKYMHDWDLMLRLFESGRVEFCNCDQPLYTYNIRHKGVIFKPDWFDYNLFVRQSQQRRNKGLAEFATLEEFLAHLDRHPLEHAKWRLLQSLGRPVRTHPYVANPAQVQEREHKGHRRAHTQERSSQTGVADDEAEADQGRHERQG